MGRGRFGRSREEARFAVILGTLARKQRYLPRNPLRTPWTAEMRQDQLRPQRLELTDTDGRVEMELHGSGTSRLEGASICLCFFFGDVTFPMDGWQVRAKCRRLA